MKSILLIVMLLLGSILSEAEEAASAGDSTDTGLFGLIMNMVSGEVRPWAKPIEYVDMDRILELKDAGLITFHEAEWYAVINDE